MSFCHATFHRLFFLWRKKGSVQKESNHSHLHFNQNSKTSDIQKYTQRCLHMCQCKNIYAKETRKNISIYLSIYPSIYLSKDDRGVTRARGIRNTQVWEAYPTIARGNAAHNQTRRGDRGRWDQKIPLHMYIYIYSCIRPN